MPLSPQVHKAIALFVLLTCNCKLAKECQVANLLEDGHPLAVDLELLAVEAHLCLPALLDVALELVDDLVFLLVPFVLRPHRVHVRAVLGLLNLLLQGEEGGGGSPQNVYKQEHVADHMCNKFTTVHRGK